MAHAHVVKVELLNETEQEHFLDESESKNTKRQLKFSLRIFQEFCAAQGDVEFDQLADIDLKSLDELLGKFYAGAKSQSGESYSKKSMQALRYGLQKHFLNLRDIDIIKDSSFAKSHRVFKAVLRKLKEEGKAKASVNMVKHHKSVSMVSEIDMNKIHNSLDLETPQGLQRRVFLDVMTHFANTGVENLYDMKTDDFNIWSEQNGRRYFHIIDKATKNHPDDDLNSQGGRMFEIPGSNRCPVETLLKYKSKLNPNLPFFWQKPKRAAQYGDGPWYDNVRVGIYTLGNMMKTISKEAGCSTEYTNHCLRAMSITTLDHAGFPFRDIMTVSGHKSDTSIEHYAQTSDQQKLKMSETVSTALGLAQRPGPSHHDQQTTWGATTQPQRVLSTSGAGLKPADEANYPISRFPIPDRESLPEDLQEIMDDVEERSGFVPNVFKMLSYHPDSFRSFFNYYNVLMDDSGNLSKADKEMIVVATSAANNCLYCIIAHSALHRIYSKDATLADEIAANLHMAALDSRQRAILDLAMNVCKNEPITEEHFSNLEAHGLDREDAFMIGSVAAFFAMSNRLAHLTSCRPNKEFHLLGRVPREEKK